MREEPVLGALAVEVRARLFPEAEGPVAALRYRTGGILREDSWFHLLVRERLRDKLAPWPVRLGLALAAGAYGVAWLAYGPRTGSARPR